MYWCSLSLPNLKLHINRLLRNELNYIFRKLIFECIFLLIVICSVCVSAGYCDGLSRIWDGKGKAVSCVNRCKIFLVWFYFHQGCSRLHSCVEICLSLEEDFSAAFLFIFFAFLLCAWIRSFYYYFFLQAKSLAVSKALIGFNWSMVTGDKIKWLISRVACKYSCFAQVYTTPGKNYVYSAILYWFRRLGVDLHPNIMDVCDAVGCALDWFRSYLSV